MGMNIKSAEAHELARELVALTGETLTTAVIVALRERLERTRQSRDIHLADELVAIGRDCAARLREPYLTTDHGVLLYDERGLPR